MGIILTLGKIVQAATQKEAEELFLNRRRHGIGGVIFTPDIQLPKWTDEDKIKLSEFYCEVAAGEDDDSRHDAKEDWQRINQNISRDLFGLSRKFNKTGNPRSLRFLFNEDFDLRPHVDIGAMDGWVHWHISGAGMLCANPIGDNPVKIELPKSFGNNIDENDFNRLLNVEKLIELVRLQEGQAIAFDNSMAHLSNSGPRFRIAAFSRDE